MRPKIVLFGDSITEYSFANEGWGAALLHHFSRKVDVVIRGYDGYNTRWAVRILDEIFCPDDRETAPLAVTVFFGANDASLPDRTCGFQHVPLDEYKQNLRAIISFFKNKWPTTHILLITPPPINEDKRLRYPYGDNPSGLPDRTNEAAGDYAKACVTVAGECKVLVVDLCTKMQEFRHWKDYYLSDGLHLTPSGNIIVFEEVVKKLKEAGLSIETLPVELPLLADIDRDDPLKAFP